MWLSSHCVRLSLAAFPAFQKQFGVNWVQPRRLRLFFARSLRDEQVIGAVLWAPALR
jgi:hypothetical protein